MQSSDLPPEHRLARLVLGGAIVATTVAVVSAITDTGLPQDYLKLLSSGQAGSAAAWDWLWPW